MSAFGKRERERQAEFRAKSETISNVARRPCDTLGKKHDYYLALGYEKENLMPAIRESDGAMQFFMDRSIKWWRGGRSGDAKGVNIPTRNMASSQIACLNFLLPLADEPDAIKAMIRRVHDDVVAVERMPYPIRGKALNSLIEFEWIGLESSLEYGPFTRGANATSADALVVARTNKGNKRAYIIEWKYVEEYQAGHSLAVGPSGATRRDRYSEMFTASDSPFINSSFEHWFYEPLYQVMRQLLLSVKMIREKEFGISEARVIVVCPKDNISFRNKITSPPMRERYQEKDLQTVVREQLSNRDLFTIVDVEDLFFAITEGARGGSVDEWSSYNRERYGFR